MRGTSIQEEYIGKIKMDYSLYDGTDYYSDGAIEDEILELVESGRSIEEILKNDSRWPILYHLSPTRENILNWYDFGGSSSVLEVGAGCGAVTGSISRTAGHVTALDLSKKRSLINASRHKNLENLDIVVSNFQNFTPSHQYDYITLIGVLEYAASYMKDENSPYTSMLTHISNMLSENGTLIIAIENKLGLKYWAGAREDHTGKFFDGLEGYTNEDSVYTFSKNEIESLLRKTGFITQMFYYPYPDYKMPSQLFSDEFLPKSGEILKARSNYDMDRIKIFSEQEVFDTIKKASLIPEFSNSFLIFASKRSD